jgi:hypothetical protein
MDLEPAYQEEVTSIPSRLRQRLVRVNEAASELLSVPSYFRLLVLCSRTRYFWDLIHDAGLLLDQEDAETIQLAREFLRTIDPVIDEKFRAGLIDLCREANAEREGPAKSYLASIAFRHHVINDLACHGPKSVYSEMLKAVEQDPKLKKIITFPVSEATAQGEDSDDIPYQVRLGIIAGALHYLDHKFLMFGIELAHEFGPFTKSLEDHDVVAAKIERMAAKFLRIASQVETPRLKQEPLPSMTAALEKIASEFKANVLDELRTLRRVVANAKSDA